MTPFRALVVAVALLIVMAALAAYLVGVPIWAVLTGTMGASFVAFFVLGRVLRRLASRQKLQG